MIPPPPASLVWPAARVAGAAPSLVPAAARADRALLGRVLEQSGAARTPEPPDASYVRELLSAALRALLNWADRLRVELGLSPAAGRALAAAVLALALVLLGRVLWRRFRRRSRQAAGVSETSGGDGGDQGEGPWDAAAWRAELDRQLAAGHVPEALHATWWWLARTLVGERAVPAWTGRDLARHAGRGDLREPLRRLEALRYGPVHPALEAVRALVARCEEALA